MQNRDKDKPHSGTAGRGAIATRTGEKWSRRVKNFLIKVGSRCKTVKQAGQVPGSVLNVIKTCQTVVPMCKFPLKSKKWKTHAFAYVRARKLKMCFFPSCGENGLYYGVIGHALGGG